MIPQELAFKFIDQNKNKQTNKKQNKKQNRKKTVCPYVFLQIVLFVFVSKK